MISIILIIGIAILASLSSFLEKGGKVIDKSKKGFKKLTALGWRVVLGLGIIILSVLQYRQNEINLSNKEIEANKKQDQRDTRLKTNYDSSLIEMKKKFDTTSTKTLLTVTETLGKYGFMLDSSNQKLVKIIRDSSKTKVILSPEPVLGLSLPEAITFVKYENGVYEYIAGFCSFDASSTNYELKGTIVVLDTSDNYIYFGKLNFLSKEVQIPKDNIITNYFHINYKLPYKILYLLLSGTYSNIDKTKSHEINTLYFYDARRKGSGEMIGKTKKEVVDFIKHTE